MSGLINNHAVDHPQLWQTKLRSSFAVRAALRATADRQTGTLSNINGNSNQGQGINFSIMSDAGTIRMPFAAYRAKCKDGQRPPLWIQTEEVQASSSDKRRVNTELKSFQPTSISVIGRSWSRLPRNSSVFGIGTINA